MFEIGIFCVIILAVSYWAVLWLMGRREDVLHGEYVEGKAEPGGTVRPVFPDPPAHPVFPQRPAIPERPAIADQSTLTERPLLRERPADATAKQPAFRPERLEQLLASIKQDLNQLVQK